jgi:hypothetical protein
MSNGNGNGNEYEESGHHQYTYAQFLEDWHIHYEYMEREHQIAIGEIEEELATVILYTETVRNS